MKNQISRTTNALFHFILAAWCVTCIYPLLLMVSISVTDPSVLYKEGFRLLPSVWSFQAYEYLASMSSVIWNAYGVTLFVTGFGTLASVSIIAMFAYPLSRRDLKYGSFFSFFVFFTMIFNGGMVPWYFVCVKILGLKDSIWALILPLLMSGFHVIIMRTFYKTTIPVELLESAKIDGASELRTFVQIVVPLSLPGLATLAVFTSIHYWNDYYLPLMLINKPELHNLQYLIYKIISNIQFLNESASQIGGGSLVQSVQVPEEGARMGLAVLTIGPIILALPILQRYFVKGLTLGAVKG